MPATTIGTQGLSWGMNQEVIGLVQSFSEARSISKNEVKDYKGEIVGVAYYNPITAYSLSVAVTGNVTVTVGGALAALANAVTLGTTRIDSLTINKSPDAFVTLDISATGYPQI
jgi:hypothetical protein